MSSLAPLGVTLALTVFAADCSSEPERSETAAEPVTAADPAPLTDTAAPEPAAAATAAAATAAAATEPAATEAAATEPAATDTEAEAAAPRRTLEARLARADLDAALADPTTAAGSARLVPAIRDGKPVGFKIYAVRPASLLASIGLKNGDTIERVNGHDLTSPDKALEVYSQLRGEDRFDIELRRRGQPLLLRLVIE